MNFWINKFQPIIEACKTQQDYYKAYDRISSCIAGMILGRSVNQSWTDFLAANPEKKDFNDWWHGVKDDLWAKASQS